VLSTTLSLAFLAHPDGRSGVGLPGFPDQHYTASAAQNHILQAVGYLLKDYAQSPKLLGELDWKRVLEDVAPIPIDFNSYGVNSRHLFALSKFPIGMPRRLS